MLVPGLVSKTAGRLQRVRPKLLISSACPTFEEEASFSLPLFFAFSSLVSRIDARELIHGIQTNSVGSSGGDVPEVIRNETTMYTSACGLSPSPLPPSLPPSLPLSLSISLSLYLSLSLSLCLSRSLSLALSRSPSFSLRNTAADHSQRALGGAGPLWHTLCFGQHVDHKASLQSSFARQVTGGVWTTPDPPWKAQQQDRLQIDPSSDLIALSPAGSSRFRNFLVRTPVDAVTIRQLSSRDYSSSVSLYSHA